MARLARSGTLLIVALAAVSALVPARAAPASVAPAERAVRGWRSNGPPGGPVQALALGPGAPERIWAGTIYTNYIFPRPGQASVSVDGARIWDVAHGLAYLPIGSFAVDQRDADVVYAGVGLNTVSGLLGVYKSTDGGAHWTHTGMRERWVVDIDIDPADSSTLYVAARGDGLWKSSDAGDTWSRMDDDIPDTEVLAVAVDPFDRDVVYAGTLSKGIYRSTDAGVNWSPARTGLKSNRASVVLPDPSVPGRVYAGTGAGIALSADGGGTWTDANAGTNSGAVLSLAIGAQHPDRLFAGTTRGAFRSDDGAGSWVPVNEGLPRTEVGAIALDPFDDDVAYAGTGVGVFKTGDAGASWHERNRGMANSDVAAFVASGQVLYAGEASRGGVYRSGDAGRTWRRTSRGLPAAPVFHLAATPRDPNTVYAVADMGLFVTTDGGRSWHAVSTPAGVLQVAVAGSDPRVVYVTTLSDVPDRYPIWRSDDGGATWTEASDELPDGSAWIVTVDPTRPEVAYAGGEGLFRTNDGGATWRQASGGIPHSFGFGGVAIDPVHPNVIYASVLGDLFLSTNRAVQWTPLDVGGCHPSGFDGNVGGVVVDPTRDGGLYITRGASICRGTDEGHAWSNLPKIGSWVAYTGIAMVADGSVLISTKGDGILLFPAS